MIFLFIFILVVVVIILSKAGVSDSLSAIVLGVIASALFGTAGGAVASIIGTPLLGVPVGIIIAILVFQRFIKKG